jgi:hypothetical protein
MTDFAFLTQLLHVWSLYVTWLGQSNNPTYGQQPVPGAYGGAVSPSLEGFFKWIEFIFLPANTPPPAS